MKKLIFVLIFTLSFSVLPVHAASQDAIDAANTLHDFGLFSGVGTNPDGSTNYDLDRTPTRAEAITMLVRLLGKEDEAKAGSWETPFTDVADWAKPYVGYAYTNGLTGGVASDKFGSSMETSATQYLTFVLRALGYNSSSDFQWDRAWELSDKLGITNGEYKDSSAFLRGDIVKISMEVLSTPQKDTSESLFSALKNNGTITNASSMDLSLTELKVHQFEGTVHFIDSVFVTKTNDGYKFFIYCIDERPYGVSVFPAEYGDAQHPVSDYPDFKSFVQTDNIKTAVFTLPISYLIENPLNTDEIIIKAFHNDSENDFSSYSFTISELP